MWLFHIIGKPPDRIPHPVSRALERYGLKLTTADLRDIALQCAGGKGRLTYQPDGNERHIVAIHNKTIVVVYSPNLGPSDLAKPHRGAGTIITVLPPEAALSGNEHSIATKFKRAVAGRAAPPKFKKTWRRFWK